MSPAKQVVSGVDVSCKVVTCRSSSSIDVTGEGVSGVLDVSSGVVTCHVDAPRKRVGSGVVVVVAVVHVIRGFTWVDATTWEANIIVSSGVAVEVTCNAVTGVVIVDVSSCTKLLRRREGSAAI